MMDESHLLRTTREGHHREVAELNEKINSTLKELERIKDFMSVWAAERDRMNLQIHNMRQDFESIVIRCVEGDKRTDWLPIIRGIAEKWSEKRPSVMILKLWPKLEGHVCGLQGFGQELDDRCPACEKGR